MLQCKLAQGTSDAFVRDVKAAPDPLCVMFFDWQLSDLVRFLTDPVLFSILGADTTYNLGDFYVTPTTYKHLMLVDVTSHKHPTMAGPVLVHQRKDFATFNYFANTLVSHAKKLHEVQAFGTDGDPALIEAFTHNFPSARQLRCFLHLKKNFLSKLRDNGIPPAVSQEFISDIFGKRIGGTYEEGLVDSLDSADFNSRLQSCRDVWNARELCYLGPGQTSFFDYFVKYHASTVCHTMLKDVRIAAGLGSPPGIFTTNANESLNAALKKKVNYKETEWPEFNDLIKKFVMAQRDDIIRATYGRGQYRITQEYTHLVVSHQQWIQMTPEQRKDVLKRFDSARLQRDTVVISAPSSGTVRKEAAKNRGSHTFAVPTPSSSNAQKETPKRLGRSDAIVNPTPSSSNARQEAAKKGDSPAQHVLSIKVKDCGITTLPFATLDAMWSKAEQYLGTNDVQQAPGDDRKSKMITSRSSSTPHFIRVPSPGHYVCDKQCLQWSSSGICSHTLVAAEVNGELKLFLQWYNSSGQEPNITTLAHAGLPAGRGRKGGVPKRKRNRGPVTTPDTVVRRLATRGRSKGSFMSNPHQVGCSSDLSQRAGSPSLSSVASGGMHLSQRAGSPSLSLVASGGMHLSQSDGSPSPSTVASVVPGGMHASAFKIQPVGLRSDLSQSACSPSLPTVASGAPGGMHRSQSAGSPSLPTVSSGAPGGMHRSQSDGSPSLPTVASGAPGGMYASHINIQAYGRSSSNFQCVSSFLPPPVPPPVTSVAPGGIYTSPLNIQPQVLSPSSTSVPNTNPFYVRFIEGNIRKCQGCKGFLRDSNGGIPAPPFDVCTARAERRTFRDAAGFLRIPQREQPAHYHLNLSCIRAVSPGFVPASLVVPDDIRQTLNTVHTEYLRLVFGVTLHH